MFAGNCEYLMVVSFAIFNLFPKTYLLKYTDLFNQTKARSLVEMIPGNHPANPVEAKTKSKQKLREIFDCIQVKQEICSDVATEQILISSSKDKLGSVNCLIAMIAW